mgnify:CR=1 FL=1
MPITINGSGTVAGLSVGGINDGAIAHADLATSTQPLFTSYAIICDEKSDGTNGGGFTKDAWQDRDLNTELIDPDNIVTISSDEFTLPNAGTYFIEWSAPAFKVVDHISRLYDVTGAAALQTGFNQTAHDNYGLVMSRSEGFHRHTITGSNTYKIQHWCNWTQASNGFGHAVAPSGTVERYTWVKIFKEAS